MAAILSPVAVGLILADLDVHSVATRSLQVIAVDAPQEAEAVIVVWFLNCYEDRVRHELQRFELVVSLRSLFPRVVLIRMESCLRQSMLAFSKF